MAGVVLTPEAYDRVKRVVHDVESWKEPAEDRPLGRPPTFYVVRLAVVETFNDYLRCKRKDGDTLIEPSIYVAKPEGVQLSKLEDRFHDLNFAGFAGTGTGGITITDTQTAEARFLSGSDSVTATLATVPEYDTDSGYESIIYAVPGYTGAEDADGNLITLRDDNSASPRYMGAKIETIE